MRVSMYQAMAAGAAALVVALITSCGGEPRYTQISAGADHTCGLRSDGSVVCWGSNEFGQLRVPEDERFTAVAAAGVHTCGLRTDGTAVCWGYTTPSGEDFAEVQGPLYKAPFPSEDERFTEIKAGGGITCGFRADGSVTCWNIQGDFPPFGTEEVVQIDPGGDSVCGLRSDGSALCYNFYGGPPPEGERFAAISTAGGHACGLSTDGDAFCWGNNVAGQVSSVANGSYIADPVSPPEDGGFSAIVTGAYHTCGLRLDSSAVCWGYDFDGWAERVSGRVPDPDDAQGKALLELQERLISISISAPPEGERFTSITVGVLHACGLRHDGGISCWGSDEHGQASPPGNSD